MTSSLARTSPRLGSTAAPREALALACFYGLALVAFIRMAGFGADLVAALVVVATFAFCWSRLLRRRGTLVAAFVVALCAHHAVAIVNAYVTTVPGADLDASTFHSFAVEFSEGRTPVPGPHEVYMETLITLYKVFGPSQLLAEELSVIAFCLSALLVCSLAERLDGRPLHAGGMLLFGLMPAALIFGSVTLREQFEALFVVLTCYAAIRLRRREGRLAPIFILLFAIVGLAVLHHGLAIWGAFSMAAALYWSFGVRMSRKAQALFWKRLGAVAVAGLLLVVGAALESGTAVQTLLTGKILEGVANFRSGAASAAGRTDYGIMVNPGSIVDFVIKVPLFFIYYMFAPFPWQVATVLDAEALCETVVRTALILGAIAAWRRSRGEIRSERRFLLLLFVALEGVWSLGTINWGTALRHHVPALGLLVVLGSRPLFSAIRSLGPRRLVGSSAA